MTCRLSVRELVEFLYQSGDLGSVAFSVERANLGSRIHRQLQRAAQGDYQSEVYLKIEQDVEDIHFIIEGRADGIRREKEQVIIEEIKTTAIPYDEITDDHFVHFAQAYCYGYIYAKQQKLSAVGIQLTYYQIESHKLRCFQQQKTYAELERFFLDTLQAYVRWARLSQQLRINGKHSLQALRFPFAIYRKGQREFASGVYKTILDKRMLFVQAPTGIGKTISALFPALKAIGEGKAEKVFYLCAKNITASVVYATLRLLYEQQQPFKCVGITAKDKICLQAERNCDPKECPYARGYYDRYKEALFKLLTKEELMEREVFIRYGKQYAICPFELSLDAALYADVIICDYNYVFDPRVYLKRFFMEKGNYVFLVDEAHNLVDRARDMYSAQLTKESFRQLKPLLPKEQQPLHTALQLLLQEFSALKKKIPAAEVLVMEASYLPLLKKLEAWIEQMDAYWQQAHDETHDEQLREVYFQAVNYLRIADHYDEHFVTWAQVEQRDIIIRQFCMNPRHPLRAMMDKGRSTILFSATLSPIEYYMELLGGDAQSNRLSLPSPFAPEHAAVIINQAISTRYRQREASLPALIAYLHAVVMSRVGNYIVFCPSYAYMNRIYEGFHEEYPDIMTSVQKDKLQEAEKQAFLRRFEKTDTRHVVFCVLGGMFSEGIDLKGERLIGVILIGVGLPQINVQQELLRQHFDECLQAGYAYAYQFPGMNKVLQAAGRVIRSVADRGVIVCIDERFTRYPYRQLFPKHLQHFQIINEPQQVYVRLAVFWQQQDREAARQDI